MTPDRRTSRLTVEPSREPGARVNLTRARGERTREVILEEATLLFSSYGYRGTSLRDISERVGISHPGMLHHFSRKEALLQAVLERVARHFEELIDDFVATAQEPAAIREWDAVRQYQSVMFAVVRAEAVEKDHPGHEAIVGMQTMAEEKLTALFKMYEEKGWLEEGAAPEWIARSIVAMWTGVFMRDALMDDGLYDHDLSIFLRMFVIPLREADPFPPKERK